MCILAAGEVQPRGCPATTCSEVQLSVRRAEQHHSVFVHPTEAMKEDLCFLPLIGMQLTQSTAYDPSDLPDWTDKLGGEPL